MNEFVTTYEVACDAPGCGESVESSTPIEKRDLVSLGWSFGSHFDLCPEHA